MQIDQQLINLIIVAIGGFLSGCILLWFWHRYKLSQLLQQTTQNLSIQYNSERRILELDLENLENELDLLRQQLANKDEQLYKKIDELTKLSELKAIYATKASQINDFKELLSKMSEKNENLTGQCHNYEKQLSDINIKSEEQLKAANLVIENLERSRQELTEQFEHLAHKIFSKNSDELKQANQQEISHLLSPFKEQFSEFKRKVEEIHEIESRDRVSLASQVTQLSSLNKKISDDTVNLTRALKGDVKFQGNWGETILENLLDSSGLRDGVEYLIQPSFRDTDNHLLRPDVIIKLPDDKTVIIDSKVSLKSYSQYASAIDNVEQEKALKKHTQSLKNHVKVLSEKDYSSVPELHSLDFVLLFVPIEQALMLAINAEPELLYEAFQKKIILVSATTLLATVRTIENFWRYDKQQSNAEEIAKRAGDMLDKFSLFVEELENIGVQLDKAKISYNTAHNRLLSGNGNLISRAKSIQELGIKSKNDF